MTFHFFVLLLTFFVKVLAGRWEVDEDAGLADLAASVKRELDAARSKALVRVWVTPPRGESFECIGYEGSSLKELAEGGQVGGDTLGEYLECACSGVMACSTCHVHVDEAWFEKVGPPSEAEQDMLDLAADVGETSRLGCQLTLAPALDGLSVRIPAETRNLFDDIPFA